IVRFTLGFGTAGSQRIGAVGSSDPAPRGRAAGSCDDRACFEEGCFEPAFTMGASVWVGGYGLVAPCGSCVTSEMQVIEFSVIWLKGGRVEHGFTRALRWP